MEKIKLLVIDEKMNTARVEVGLEILKQLGVIKENVKKHSRKSHLNREITSFLNHSPENIE